MGSPLRKSLQFQKFSFRTHKKVPQGSGLFPAKSQFLNNQSTIETNFSFRGEYGSCVYELPETRCQPVSVFEVPQDLRPETSHDKPHRKPAFPWQLSMSVLSKVVQLAQ